MKRVSSYYAFHTFHAKIQRQYVSQTWKHQFFILSDFFTYSFIYHDK
ncbi:hypothetical protein CLOSTHATH_05011 [Hungatella hathewayi DSM 13479]|uniref:Uncharacterized protein n=1 Tax=Hungatella hathewayi DSM 13479 TaxID=566550 RepID=D3AN11_9FIRM|nr:hypothetical protein CLOSTHATH_05011 [Hungatella hathewayi DSM 13479]